MGCAASKTEAKVEGPSGNLAKRVIEEVKNGKKDENMEHRFIGEEKEKAGIFIEVKNEPTEN